MRMAQRYSFKNKVVRAGFYVASIGGLMLLFAGLLCVSWNSLVAARLDYAPLSFLEAVGLVSIAYIFYSSIRFSSHDEVCADLQHESLSRNQESLHSTATPYSAQQRGINELNGEQREQLRREIERCCGKQSLDNIADTAAESRQSS